MRQNTYEQHVSRRDGLRPPATDVSPAATLLIAGGLYARWARAGRPTGIEDVEARAETL
ncbi:MAG: hypothetical protein JF621_13715 [Streptomyces turgidiscabies]|nr:hypothetical protein [Streptomyces turgidiscabies]